MSKLYRLFLILCAFSFFSSTVSSQDFLRITVESAVEMAVEYNLPLKMSSIDVSLAELYNNTAWNNYVPSIYLGANVSRDGNIGLYKDNTAQNVEKENWLWQASIGASLALNSYSFSIKEELSKLYRKTLIEHQNNVSRLKTDVKIAFYELIAMQEDVSIALSDLERAQAKFMQDEQYYNQGVTSETEVLRSQVALENAKSNVAIKKFTQESAMAEFRDLVGIDRDIDIELEGSIDISVEHLDSYALVAKHLYNRSDVQIALIDLELLVAQKRDTALSDFTPTLQAEYAFIYGDNFYEQNQFYDSGSLSLSLRVPLDSFIPGTKSNNRYADITSEIEKQEIYLQKVINDAENDVYNMVRQLERSKALLETLTTTKEIAERSYNITYASYTRGEIPYYNNVSDVESELDTARVRVLAEQYNYLSLLLNLEYALNLDE